MKIKINSNILWTDAFVNQLVSLGVRSACISPGSRNTPLTIAFANNEKIKSYVLIDERSGGYFALGLAKASGLPVALICTSGTATAEYYPAIIEAYQYRIPLIICTADRPPELLNSGANQTINQNNIYKNHIIKFYNPGLPDPSQKKIKNLQKLAVAAFNESNGKTKGPVHINFPFKKPFEPFDYTDKIDDKLLKIYEPITATEIVTKAKPKKEAAKKIEVIFEQILKSKRGIIIAGPDDPDEDFPELCCRLSEKLNYPIIADGASQLRFGLHSKNNMLVNYESYLRSDKFSKKIKPDLILHFGKTIISKGLEIYLEKLKSPRFMINRFGDWHDPAHRSLSSVAIAPSAFCKTILEKIDREKLTPKNDTWLKTFIAAEDISRKHKLEIIEKADFPFEGRVITECMELIPAGSNIMVSNSMPIRDMDYFAGKSNKQIRVFNNRGASGIDGIISTALGISEYSDKPTFLITGDLAFYYDLNGLLTAVKYNIPLVIILIDNNGGGIFEMLPIAKYEKLFSEYFITPHNLDFSLIVKAYGGNYYNVESWDNLRETFVCAANNNSFSVLRISTDAKNSSQLRKNFWSFTAKQIEAALFKKINE